MPKKKLDVKKKRIKKKVSKTAFKDIINSLQITIKENWYYKVNENFLVFSPFGSDTPCDVIGIDIGTKHLGISGISKVEYRKHPIWTWCSLISVPSETLHQSVDRIVDILYQSPYFEWFRNCSSYRIELQMQVNPKARAVSCVLRTLARIFQLKSQKPINVEFVHGKKKNHFY